MATAQSYPVRLSIDYPERSDRFTVLLRIVLAIPILIVLGLVTGGGGSSPAGDAGEGVRTTSSGFTAGLAVATAFMIAVRRRYPRWWFDFALALDRFSYRVGAYLLLLRDEYPSTEEEQAVHLEVDYPDASTLDRLLPLVKWLLAIPHYVVLVVLVVVAAILTVVAWLVILVTGRYPRGIFDFVVGVGRWGLRVQAYAFLLVTDRYPPFSLS